MRPSSKPIATQFIWTWYLVNMTTYTIDTHKQKIGPSWVVHVQFGMTLPLGHLLGTMPKPNFQVPISAPTAYITYWYEIKPSVKIGNFSELRMPLAFHRAPWCFQKFSLPSFEFGKNDSLTKCCILDWEPTATNLSSKTFQNLDQVPPCPFLLFCVFKNLALSSLESDKSIDR
jgi:hypothetical protein